MSDVFRAVTLSFLIAVVFLLLSAGIDYLAINHLQSGDDRYSARENFRLALATTSLHASLLCIWVLLATAFAKKYVSRLRPGLSLITALSIAIPLVAIARLLPLLDPRGLWSPTVGLVVSLLWSSLGLHGVLWYLTVSIKPSNDA
jgi:hypothetical protein